MTTPSDGPRSGDGDGANPPGNGDRLPGDGVENFEAPAYPDFRAPFPPTTQEELDAAAWGTPLKSEWRWSASAAVVAAIGLQLILPSQLNAGLGLHVAIPLVEALLLVIVAVMNPHRANSGTRRLRTLSISLVALITAANLASLYLLLAALLDKANTNGRSLVYGSVPIWLTNVIVFGLWYWELDRGGIGARMHGVHRQPDFMFPQMTNPAVAPGWSPVFFDYLYTSFTNATAFSPTDTMPLTHWAKFLMMIQAMASVLLTAVVISRAINILN